MECSFHHLPKQVNVFVDCQWHYTNIFLGVSPIIYFQVNMARIALCANSDCMSHHWNAAMQKLPCMVKSGIRKEKGESSLNTFPRRLVSCGQASVCMEEAFL